MIQEYSSTTVAEEEEEEYLFLQNNSKGTSKLLRKIGYHTSSVSTVLQKM